ncbi:MAG: helix-turn-helix transcriptional regulator, partial [Gordonibacter sp.]|uniref:helix-turn-helix domain-containing protein n=1 Tax=Gordonibacter sp. TaxID=1968902 RepID=UPI002FC8378B
THLFPKMPPSQAASYILGEQATGMNQRSISRLEMGNTNPTVRTLDRLAKGFGKRLEIRFV